MNIAWNPAQEHFEAQFSPDYFRDDLALAKLCGFQTTGKPDWIWYAETAQPLLQLQMNRPGYGITIELDALDIFNRMSGSTLCSLQSSRALTSDIQIPVPDRKHPLTGRKLEYFPYQKAAIEYALSRTNVLFADEPGLGKTLEAVGLSNADPDCRKILIVCPKTPKLYWRDTWLLWDVKDLTVGVVQGSKNPLPETDVVIMNFEIAAKHHESLISRSWDILIVDESHKLSNPNSQRSMFLLGRKARKKKLPTGEVEKFPAIPGVQARRKVFLTGTPIPNRVVELWPMLEKIDPEGLGANKWRFCQRYCGAKKNHFGWDFSGSSNLEELQDRMRAGFMVRRLKSEVMKDLPAKIRRVVLIEPDHTGEQLLKKERTAWEGFQANSADLSLKGSYFTLRKEVGIYKTKFVQDHIDDLLEVHQKIIVFAHHKEVIQKLVEHYAEKAVRIDGQTSTEDRHSAVQRFQTDPGISLIILSIEAAGTSITLTAAQIEVFAEQVWVPGTLSQAEDRAHRYGQGNQLLIEHIILDKSLDSEMINTVIQKQQIIDVALDKTVDKTVDKMPGL